jgi:hypothetical protein
MKKFILVYLLGIIGSVDCYAADNLKVRDLDTSFTCIVSTIESFSISLSQDKATASTAKNGCDIHIFGNLDVEPVFYTVLGAKESTPTSASYYQFKAEVPSKKLKRNSIRSLIAALKKEYSELRLCVERPNASGCYQSTPEENTVDEGNRSIITSTIWVKTPKSKHVDLGYTTSNVYAK